MNIIPLNNTTIQTMSRREIAELTGKDHKNVMRDIRSMLDQLKIEPVEFAGSYIGAKGEMRDCFNLPKRETMILISGYSVVLRSRIIDRWQELEAQAARMACTWPVRRRSASSRCGPSRYALVCEQ